MTDDDKRACEIREQAEMAIAAGQRIGPYVVERALPAGRGGFAQVVLARNPHGRGELVALKVQHAQKGQGHSTAFEAELDNEVAILRRVRHPGIVRIVPMPIDPERPIYIARDLNLPGAPWYFAMEYLAGGTLAELISRRGALDPALAAEITVQVGEALTYLHHMGIAHLDVKPRNIMFRQPLAAGQMPQVVLGDLGVAQIATLSPDIEGGSIEYLAPERLPLLEGKPVPNSPEARAAADVYSLGVTLYDALTGELPFRGTRTQIENAIRWEQPQSPKRVPAAARQADYQQLHALALAMLNKQPELRPTADTVVQQIDRAAPPPRAWQSDPEVTTASQGPKRPFGASSRRKRPHWRTVYVAAAALCLLLLGGYSVGAGFWGKAWEALAGVSAEHAQTTVSTSTPVPTAAPVTVADVATPDAAADLLGDSLTTTSDQLVLLSPKDDAELIDSTPTLEWDFRSLESGAEVFLVSYRREGEAESTVRTSNPFVTLDLADAAAGQYYWRVAVQTQDAQGQWTTVAESNEGEFLVSLAVDTADGTSTLEATATLSAETATPASAGLALVSPTSGDSVESTSLDLRWSFRELGADEVFVVLYQLDGTSNPLSQETTSTSLRLEPTGDSFGRCYWQVVVRSKSSGTWQTVEKSPVWSFLLNQTADSDLDGGDTETATPALLTNTPSADVTSYPEDDDSDDEPTPAPTRKSATMTSVPATATLVSATKTPRPATATPMPPTNTPRTRTSTPAPEPTSPELDPTTTPVPEATSTPEPWMTNTPKPRTATPVPDTPVPATPVPDTPVPATPVPDTPVPDTPAPDTPMPNTPVPDTPVPDMLEEPPEPDTPEPLEEPGDHGCGDDPGDAWSRGASR